MLKGPNEPIDPRDRGDRLRLPPDFGRREAKILPFNRRPEGLTPARSESSGGGDDNPLDMLRWLYTAIQEGRIKPEAMFVGTVELHGQDAEHYPMYVCNLTRLAVKGLLNEYLEDLP